MKRLLYVLANAFAAVGIVPRCAGLLDRLEVADVVVEATAADLDDATRPALQSVDVLSFAQRPDLAGVGHGLVNPRQAGALDQVFGGKSDVRFTFLD